MIFRRVKTEKSGWFPFLATDDSMSYWDIEKLEKGSSLRRLFSVIDHLLMWLIGGILIILVVGAVLFGVGAAIWAAVSVIILAFQTSIWYGLLALLGIYVLIKMMTSE